jgi:hypothetical protein
VLKGKLGGRFLGFKVVFFLVAAKRRFFAAFGFKRESCKTNYNSQCFFLLLNGID